MTIDNRHLSRNVPNTERRSGLEIEPWKSPEKGWAHHTAKRVIGFEPRTFL